MNAYRLLSFIISIDFCRLLIHLFVVLRRSSEKVLWQHVTSIHIIILNTNNINGMTCVLVYYVKILPVREINRAKYQEK